MHISVAAGDQPYTSPDLLICFVGQVRRILRMNPVIICGALAGSMTVDAAVTGCCERADSQTPVLGVAVPYAVGNVLLTILGPVIVTLTYSG
jgi:putative transport protein